MAESPLLTFSKAQFEKESGLANKLRAHQFGLEIGRADVEQRRQERETAQQLNTQIGLLNATKGQARVGIIKNIGQISNIDVSDLVSMEDQKYEDIENYANVLRTSEDPNVVTDSYNGLIAKYGSGIVAAPLEKKVDVTIGGVKHSVTEAQRFVHSSKAEIERIKKGEGATGVSKKMNDAALAGLKFLIDAYAPGVSIEDMAAGNMTAVEGALGQMPESERQNFIDRIKITTAYTQQSLAAAGGGRVETGGSALFEAMKKRGGELKTGQVTTKEVKKEKKAVTDVQEIERLKRVKRSATDELKMQALKASTQLNKSTVNELAESNPRGLLQLIKPKISKEAYRKLVRELALPDEDKKSSKSFLRDLEKGFSIDVSGKKAFSRPAGIKPTGDIL